MPTNSQKNNSKFIFPVTNYSHPIDRAFKLNKSDEIKFLKKEMPIKTRKPLKNLIMMLVNFTGEKKILG